MHPEMSYKHCKFRKNRGRDIPLQSVYILKFSEIFSFFRSNTQNFAAMRVKFGTEEWTFSPLFRTKFHPHR